jgi:hypothetical protein
MHAISSIHRFLVRDFDVGDPASDLSDRGKINRGGKLLLTLLINPLIGQAGLYIASGSIHGQFGDECRRYRAIGRPPAAACQAIGRQELAQSH